MLAITSIASSQCNFKYLLFEVSRLLVLLDYTAAQLLPPTPPAPSFSFSAGPKLLLLLLLNICVFFTIMAQVRLTGIKVSEKAPFDGRSGDSPSLSVQRHFGPS